MSNKFILIFILVISSCVSVKERIINIEQDFTLGVNKLNDKIVEKVSAISKEKHYERNKRQPFLPAKETQITLMDNWQNYWVYDGHLATHNLLKDSYNISYRGIGKNKHIQVVFDRYGDLVTSDEDMGTYDFGIVYKSNGEISKKGLHRHFRKDVYPWIYWGNSQNDRTTKEQRIAALLKSIKQSKNPNEQFSILHKLMR